MLLLHRDVAPSHFSIFYLLTILVDIFMLIADLAVKQIHFGFYLAFWLLEILVISSLVPDYNRLYFDPVLRSILKCLPLAITALPALLLSFTLAKLLNLMLLVSVGYACCLSSKF